MRVLDPALADAGDDQAMAADEKDVGRVLAAAVEGGVHADIHGREVMMMPGDDASSLPSRLRRPAHRGT
jgi:hypothetical protein